VACVARMRCVFLLFLSVLCADATAQVYRCTNAAGKVEYSDAPCAVAHRENRVVAPKVERSQRELELENELLRRQISDERSRRQLRDSRAVEAPQVQTPYGRTEADLQAERADSHECARAKRDYEVILSSIAGKSRAPAAEAAMYSACGMRAPDKTTINVRPRLGATTCVQSGSVLHCN